MDLFEHGTEEQMRREDAAARLRELADQLSRHNKLSYRREGMRYTVDVPSQVTLEVEIEVGDEGSELEIEISW